MITLHYWILVSAGKHLEQHIHKILQGIHDSLVFYLNGKETLQITLDEEICRYIF